MNAAEVQMKPEGKGRVIIDLVMHDLKERDKIGKVKYGESLKAHNGRDALLDAYQEALDLCMYLRQAIEEKDSLAKCDTCPDFHDECFGTLFDICPKFLSVPKDSATLSNISNHIEIPFDIEEARRTATALKRKNVQPLEYYVMWHGNRKFFVPVLATCSIVEVVTVTQIDQGTVS